MQVMTVASVTLSLATCVAYAALALTGAGGMGARWALALSVLAAFSTAPLHADDTPRDQRVVGLGLYGVTLSFRALGLAVAALSARPDEAWVQGALGALLQALLLVRPDISPRGLGATFGGVVLFAALAGLTRHALPPAAPLGLAWGVLTVVRWAQAERFLQRILPRTDHGRLAPWRHPGPRVVAWPLEQLANSRVMQLLLEPLPVVEMRSDITEVIYVNYLVEAGALARFVPEGLALQRLGPGGRYALFTFLTYHHGHFGFSALGPLRRLFPSPFQTNWRVHVRDPRTGRAGVRFVTTAIDWTAPALGARLLSEGMPMHVLRGAAMTRDGALIALTLDPGRGSAPDARMSLRPASASAAGYREAGWSEPWSSCFGDFRALLEYCVPQDVAMDAQPWRARVSRQEIHLGIPLDACERLVGEVRSDAARAIVGDAQPVCFRVPGVAFRFRVEAYDPMERPGDAPP